MQSKHDLKCSKLARPVNKAGASLVHDHKIRYGHLLFVCAYLVWAHSLSQGFAALASYAVAACEVPWLTTLSRGETCILGTYLNTQCNSITSILTALHALSPVWVP